MITTKDFWTGAAERAVKTFSQVFVAVVFLGVGADAVGATAGLADVDWIDALSVAGLATVLSVATSIGNASFTAGAPATDTGVTVNVSAGDASLDDVARGVQRALHTGER